MRKTINHIINFFWTLLAFYPVLDYWYHTGINNWFIVSIFISTLIGFAPGKFYRQLHFSKRRSFYENLGVKIIRKFVQNGDLVKKVQTEKESTIIKDVASAKKYLLTLEMYSRFHWVCFFFFLFSSFHAIFTGQALSSFVMLLANILYNITAILLQQYNKMRIQRILTIVHDV
ncbi:MAG TPA: hypothetical protein DCQ50_11825 [Chryseobacterium sp.]|nr:hypothetical protein [Chryseobacterium sp.]